MPSDNDEGNYRVGYRKPPLHSQFKKGESGNKRGRRKGTKNITTVIRDELNQRLFITENGKRRSITKLQAVVKQLFNKAATGDMKATRILFHTFEEQGDFDRPVSQERQIIMMELPEIRPGEDRSYRNVGESAKAAKPDQDD